MTPKTSQRRHRGARWPIGGAVLLGVLAVELVACQPCGGVQGGGVVASSAAPSGTPSAPEATKETAQVEEMATKETAQVEEILQDARRGGARDVDFVVPSEEEARRYGEWVASVAREVAAADGPPPTAGTLAGFLRKRVSGRGDLLALVEEPAGRRGAGAVVLRCGAARRVLVEAPHTWFDVGTLSIAVATFEALDARALLVNTVHRYASTGHEPPASEDEGGSASDVAHASVSHFKSAHEALLVAEPGAITIQIHGFSEVTLKGTDVVLSAATTDVPLGPVADAVRIALHPAVVRTYPNEIRALGGTTNVQAAASRARGAGFLHVELSRAARKRLEDPAVLKRFARALRAVSPEAVRP